MERKSKPDSEVRRNEEGEASREKDADGTPPATAKPERENARALTVVGMGGSAGSISALQAFFENVHPSNNGHGSAYVVVLHLSSEYESHLPEVLGRSTSLPVHQVTQTVSIQADHVYVIPPGKGLEMRDGTLVLRDPEQTPGRRVVIDTFFRTLAYAHGPQAAAIVFSGTGADGTLGIRQIKESGGLVVAQSPSEAEYDAMPRSAIATGLVDYVLPAGGMPSQIAAYWETSRVMRIPEDAAPSPEQRAEGDDQEAALLDILTHARVQTGHDFAFYKRATVLRRIGRRMQVNGMETLPNYRDFLRTHPTEVSGLIGDLLISVTQFFRDPQAWATLERDVIPRLFVGKTGGETEVRAWVCGCATGEEAYTLAILLLEHAERLPRPPVVQVFATDMDEPALARARAAIYPETIAGDMSEERLRRWFYHQNGSYQVRKEVREVVLFAHHDVLRDTPFSRLDLVTCRNLLIYLNGDAQERVFRTFHFALRPDGSLMLGPSESAEGGDGLFLATNKSHRLFTRRTVSRSTLPPIPTPLFEPNFSLKSETAEDTIGRVLTSRANRVPPGSAEGESVQVTPLPLFLSQAGAGSENGVFRDFLPRYGPLVAVVNEEYNIVHLSGSVSNFLRFPDGEPTFNLLELVHPNLRPDLRGALFGARRERAEQTRVVRTAVSDDPEENVSLPPTPAIRLSVRPVFSVASSEATGGVGYFVVQCEALSEAVLLPLRPLLSQPPLFESASAATPGDAAHAGAAQAAAEAEVEAARRLEQENAALQRDVRIAAEQYDVVTEELKASNEEMQATNEEMRSVVEELETGKEELQSVNEELSTVNFELKARVDELTAANSDLSNFLGATDMATLFLDRILNVKRFTPATLALFNLIPTDVGRPLAHVTNLLDYPALEEDAKSVLARLIPVEREVTSADGQRHFMARLLPYRSLDDRIEGVVITFVDITLRKRAEEVMRQSEERLQTAINIDTVGVVFLNNAIEITDCNEAFVRMSGYTRKEIKAGRFSWDVFTPKGFVEASSRAIEEMNATGSTTPYEKEYVRKDGTRFWALFAAKRISENEIVEFVTDITEQKRAEATVRESETRLQTLADAIPQVIWANFADGTANYFNQRWYEYSGLTYEQSAGRGRGWQAIVHPDDAPASVDKWEHALAAGEVFDTEYRLRGADGTYRWFLGRNIPLKDTAGAVTGWFGSATDIEDYKQAQAARQESEERFRIMVEGAQDYAMFLLNPSGRITFWSKGAERIFGWTEAEATGQDFDMISVMEDVERDETKREMEAARREGQTPDRRWHVRKDGSRFWADGLLMRLDDEQGNVRGFAKVARDATEQKLGAEALEAAIEAVAQANDALETRVQERTLTLSERTQELSVMSELRQELVGQLVTAQEEERARIARDLHDDTGQQITGLLLGLSALKNSPAIAADAAAQAAVSEFQWLANDVAQKSHRIALNLRPTALDDIGLMQALQNYAEQWNGWSGLTLALDSVAMEAEEGKPVRFAQEIETTIYRVTQEALTNVLRHAIGSKGNKAARRVSVVVQRRVSDVQTIIEDDGPGFDVKAALNVSPSKRRLGLFGMQERARMVGGTLEIESSPSEGTTLYLRIPLPAATEATEAPLGQTGKSS